MINTLHSFSQNIIVKNSNQGEYLKLVDHYKTNDYYKFAISKDILKKHLAYNNDNKFYYAFFNMEKQQIGYMTGYLPSYANILWIQTLIIFEKYGRQGFGTEIVESIADCALTSTPIDTIYLACSKSNHIGIRFWKSLNFSDVTNKMKDLKPPSMDTFIFKKSLTR